MSPAGRRSSTSLSQAQTSGSLRTAGAAGPAAPAFSLSSTSSRCAQLYSPRPAAGLARPRDLAAPMARMSVTHETSVGGPRCAHRGPGRRHARWRRSACAHTPRAEGLGIPGRRGPDPHRVGTSCAQSLAARISRKPIRVWPAVRVQGAWRTGWWATARTGARRWGMSEAAAKAQAEAPVAARPWRASRTSCRKASTQVSARKASNAWA